MLQCPDGAETGPGATGPGECGLCAGAAGGAGTQTTEAANTEREDTPTLEESMRQAELQAQEHHDAWLLLDDAHGFGVVGAQGRGTLSHFGLASPRVILMGTLGKAAGVSGAFVAAEQVVIDTLVNHARSYVYTTATPPALASALLQSLHIIEQGDALRAHLRQLVAQLRDGLRDLPWQLMPSDTAIQPLLVGDNRQALALSEKLRERGIWVAAIRPPTVPQGTARLRITLSAAHRGQDVSQLVEALHDLAA